jgi:hypothetical protein
MPVRLVEVELSAAQLKRLAESVRGLEASLPDYRITVTVSSASDDDDSDDDGDGDEDEEIEDEMPGTATGESKRELVRQATRVGKDGATVKSIEKRTGLSDKQIRGVLNADDERHRYEKQMIGGKTHYRYRG